MHLPANLSKPSITHSCALMIRFKLLFAKNDATRSGPNFTMLPVPAGSRMMFDWIPNSFRIISSTIYLNQNQLGQTKGCLPPAIVRESSPHGSLPMVGPATRSPECNSTKTLNIVPHPEITSTYSAMQANNLVLDLSSQR
jgi:hypothetical protein